MELPRPLGTPSSRGRMSYISNFQWFIFLLLKRRWIQKHCFWRRRSSKHKQKKFLPDTNNFPRPFAFVTRRIEYKHLWCAKIKPIMNLCTSVFVYVGSIGLYKRIVNAYTQSIRIANADGQVLPLIQANIWAHLLLLYFSLISL